MLTPALFIRVHILEMSQKSLSAALDVTQPRISQWEDGPGLIPEKHREKVRELAARKKKALPNGYFTRVPIVPDSGGADE